MSRRHLLGARTFYDLASNLCARGGYTVAHMQAILFHLTFEKLIDKKITYIYIAL